MANFLELREERRREWEKYSRTPANRRLKYFAITFILLALLCQLSAFAIMVLFPAYDSEKTILILKGAAGACAVIFAVFLIILSYRINRAAIHDRWHQ
ncbi:MAG: hypothetical protein K2H15_01475 [Muribaculaceae bacterium]|nr:hypothetical protein [Muribaculaceae bacterium]